MDFGSVVVELRKEQGISQTDLASQLDIHKNVFGRYERNEVLPSVEIANKIADALGVTLDYLVKDGEYEEVDKETLKRLKDIQKMTPENKNHVFALLDAFIKQTKLQSVLQ